MPYTRFTHTLHTRSRAMARTPHTHPHTPYTVHTPVRTATRRAYAMPNLLPPHRAGTSHPRLPRVRRSPQDKVGTPIPHLCPQDILNVPVMPRSDQPTPHRNGGTSSTLLGPPWHPQGASRARAGFHSLFRILYLLQTYNSLNIDCKTPFAKICYVRSARSRRSSSRRPRLR